MNKTNHTREVKTRTNKKAPAPMGAGFNIDSDDAIREYTKRFTAVVHIAIDALAVLLAQNGYNVKGYSTEPMNNSVQYEIIGPDGTHYRTSWKSTGAESLYWFIREYLPTCICIETMLECVVDPACNGCTVCEARAALKKARGES